MEFTTITFPGLGITLNPPYGIDLSKLGINYTINFYTLILATGLLLACLYGLRRGKEFGLTQDDILDGLLITFPIAIICARAYYCAFEWERYAANPIEVLYVWNGGIAIYGGVIGAVIGITAYCLVKKIPIGTALDITAISFLIGQSIGRWGNFFNREAFGAQTEIFLRMGLTNAATGAVTYHHPTFLYESLWNAAGFALLHFWSKRRKYDGQMALGYAAWYGLGRTFIEGLRTDSLWWGPFRVSQMLGAISCFAAVVLLVIFSFRDHDPAKLYVNRVAAKKAEEEAALETVEEPLCEESEETETPAAETEEAAGETPETTEENTEA